MKMIKMMALLLVGLFSVTMSSAAAEQSFALQERIKSLTYDNLKNKLDGFGTLKHIFSEKGANFPFNSNNADYLAHAFNEKFPITDKPFFWSIIMSDIFDSIDHELSLKYAIEFIDKNISSLYNDIILAVQYKNPKSIYRDLWDYYITLRDSNFMKKPNFEINLPIDQSFQSNLAIPEEEAEIVLEMPETPEQTLQKLNDFNSRADIIGILRYIVNQRVRNLGRWEPFTRSEVEKLVMLYAKALKTIPKIEYFEMFLSTRTAYEALNKLWNESNHIVQTIFQPHLQEDPENLRILINKIYSEIRPPFTIDLPTGEERLQGEAELQTVEAYCVAIGTLRYIVSQHLSKLVNWYPLTKDDIAYLSKLYAQNFYPRLNIFKRLSSWNHFLSGVLAAPYRSKREKAFEKLISEVKSKLDDLVTNNAITENYAKVLMEKANSKIEPPFPIYLPSYGYLELTTRAPMPVAETPKPSKTPAAPKKDENKPSTKPTPEKPAEAPKKQTPPAQQPEIKPYSMQELVALMALFANEPQAASKKIKSDKQKMQRLGASVKSGGMARGIAQAILKSVNTLPAKEEPQEEIERKSEKPTPKPAAPKPAPKPTPARTRTPVATPTPSVDKPAVAPADPAWLKQTATAVGRNFRSINALRGDAKQIEAVRAAAALGNSDAKTILNKLGMK